MSEPLLSATDIAELALLSESTMQDTCVVIRDCAPVDDGGGVLLPGAATETTLPCTFGENRALPTNDNDSDPEERGRYRLAVPRTWLFRPTDRVRYRGVTYKVVWAPPLSFYSVESMAGLEEA